MCFREMLSVYLCMKVRYQHNSFLTLLILAEKWSLLKSDLCGCHERKLYTWRRFIENCKLFIYGGGGGGNSKPNCSNFKVLPILFCFILGVIWSISTWKLLWCWRSQFIMILFLTFYKKEILNISEGKYTIYEITSVWRNKNPS